MIVCLDVDYREDHAVVGCVGFDRWTDEAPALERAVRVARAPGAYQPGAFYLRELPYLLEALAQLPGRPDAIVIDGYVWLGDDRPGLGARLHEALGARTPVIGVAKRRFEGARAVEVRRGTSAQPLFLTAVGTSAADAARHVGAMHGPHRIPTLLKRADRLAREG